MAVVCRSDDSFLLACPAEESRITIRRATIGLFSTPCSDSCCAPNIRRDCSNDLQTDHSDTFEQLQQQCDGQQWYCSYEFNHHEIKCSVNAADYLQVFYDCSNIEQGPVAFTAQNLRWDSLESEAVFPYRDLISNYGNHFSYFTYSFTCPYDGVYSFSVTIRAYNDDFGVSLNRNRERLVRVYANALNGEWDSSSGSVVTECLSGDVVWVEVEEGANFPQIVQKFHHFSGFLLNRL